MTLKTKVRVHTAPPRPLFTHWAQDSPQPPDVTPAQFRVDDAESAHVPEAGRPNCWKMGSGAPDPVVVLSAGAEGSPAKLITCEFDPPSVSVKRAFRAEPEMVAVNEVALGPKFDIGELGTPAPGLLFVGPGLKLNAIEAEPALVQVQEICVQLVNEILVEAPDTLVVPELAQLTLAEDAIAGDAPISAVATAAVAARDAIKRRGFIYSPMWTVYANPRKIRTKFCNSHGPEGVPSIRNGARTRQHAQGLSVVVHHTTRPLDAGGIEELGTQSLPGRTGIEFPIIKDH